MKKLFTLSLAIFMAVSLWAQAPQAFKYQAVARDTDGDPIVNHQISIKISILAGSPEGTVV